MKNKKLIGILFGLVLGVFGLLGPLDLLSPSGPTGKWPSKRLLSGVSFAQGITTDRGARPDTGTANPVPLINLPLAPDTALPDGSGGILTVNGTGFVSGSVVNWNGAPRATTFVSQSQVKAKILSSDVAQRDTASVTVVNPGPGGGTSNVAFFSVTVPTSSVELGGPTGFDAGSVPYDVAVADFNGDGKLDLAVMNGGSNNVSVLLGNGDGTFQAAVNYDVGPNPNRGIVVGDFNGDGKPDLAVSDSGSNEVSVLLGNGDGTFQAAVNYGVGMYPSGIAVGDFNRDGKLDLVVPNQNCPEGGPCGASTVSVLLGNDDGTFQPHVDYAVGSSDPNWVTVGDFNGDGKLDLAVAYGYPVMSGVSILLGNGDGTFQPPVNYWFGVNNATIATADFNGDGKLDLAVVDNADTLWILLGNGDGTFQTPVGYEMDFWPLGLGVADFNGDGKLDLAVASGGENTLQVFLGNGDGTFQSPLTFAGGSNPGGLAVGDFDESGRPDVAITDRSGDVVSILLQLPTVSLSPASLNFADQLIGTRSQARIVTVTNTGPVPLSVSHVVITGTNAPDFGEINTCNSSLLPGSNCTVSVGFRPTAAGTRTASLTIYDNAGGSPQAVALMGAGTVVELSPGSANFGHQGVGTTSQPQTITLTNTGATALSITGIAISGADFSDFAYTNTCGASLAANASCLIHVTFTPQATGSRTASLDVIDGGGGSPQKVTLTGTGT